jgi:hypothetical protein
MNTAKTISKPINITATLPWFSIVLIPLLLPGPQILVGTIVNVLLFSQSKKLDSQKLIILAVLPSIAAISHGLLFGPFTIYIVYFLPFIWLGNFILMYVNKKTNSFIYSSFAKAFFLTSIALVLVNFKLVPTMFLTAMSVFQLGTALAGGLLINLCLKPKN